MSKDIKFLDYSKLIRENLLNLVKYALKKTSDYGLSDGHHFYITFKTKFKENYIPQYLLKNYPEEMMIVIENEYWDLKVDNAFFSIDLTFYLIFNFNPCHNIFHGIFIHKRFNFVLPWYNCIINEMFKVLVNQLCFTLIK